MQARDAQARTIHLRDYQPPGFLISQTELRVELGDDETLVSAKLHLYRNTEAVAGPLILDGQ